MSKVSRKIDLQCGGSVEIVVKRNSDGTGDGVLRQQCPCDDRAIVVSNDPGGIDSVKKKLIDAALMTKLSCLQTAVGFLETGKIQNRSILGSHG